MSRSSLCNGSLSLVSSVYTLPCWHEWLSCHRFFFLTTTFLSQIPEGSDVPRKQLGSDKLRYNCHLLKAQFARWTSPRLLLHTKTFLVSRVQTLRFVSVMEMKEGFFCLRPFQPEPTPTSLSVSGIGRNVTDGFSHSGLCSEASSAFCTGFIL